MILFTILLITLIILAVLTVLVISATGAAFIIVFADVIVCAVLIVFLMKWLLKRKHR